MGRTIEKKKTVAMHIFWNIIDVSLKLRHREKIFHKKFITIQNGEYSIMNIRKFSMWKIYKERNRIS